MTSRQCMLAIKPEDIEREKSDALLAKRQIHQYFSLSINYAILYMLNKNSLEKARPGKVE